MTGAALAAHTAAAQTLTGASVRPGAATALETALAYHTERGGRALVLLRNGVQRLETYASGSQATTGPLGAGSIPFCTVLAAALVDDRLLDLGEPVVMTLSEWSFHPVKSRIVVRDLLARTSGLQAKGVTTVEAALAVEPVAEPGAVFSLDDVGPMVFAEIARRKLSNSGRDSDPALYLQTRVLDPIGAAPIRFERGPDGWARLADGAVATAQAWAAFGELVRRGGVWKARWLVSTSALSEAQIANAATSRCGLGWWLGSGAPISATDPLRAVTDMWDLGPGRLPSDLLMAAGDGGQRLYISPSRRLVAARLAEPGSEWSDSAFLALLLAAV